MILQDNINIKILSARGRGIANKKYDVKCNISDTISVPWEKLKTSSYRKEKILISCDSCEKKFHRQIRDVNNNKNLCKSCSKTGDKNPAFGKPAHPNTITGVKKWMKENGNPAKRPEIRKKISEAVKGNKNMLGHHHSEETRTKISNSNKKIFGSVEMRKTIRLRRIAEMQRDIFNGNQIIPSYNPIACKLMDEYGNKNGYKFQHAMNGGEHHIKELGYFVDGYDKNKNTVLEYQEKKHNNMVEKDLKRKNEIIDFLKCEFIEMWYDGKIIISSREYK